MRGAPREVSSIKHDWQKLFVEGRVRETAKNVESD
jgi:hypothetical protein